MTHSKIESPTIEEDAALPRVGPTRAPIPGWIREELEDFEVVEIPAYEPSGEGEHLFVRLRKRDFTTKEAVKRLARALDVDPGAAGWAGMKDRRAVTEQWVSLHEATAEAALAVELEGIEVLDAIPHSSKLKTGHLLGNRFRLRVRGTPADRLDDVRSALATLVETGIPNYFGLQRFGRDGDNYERARSWIVDGGRAPRGRFERKILVSSLQSELFNRLVAARVRQGELGRVFEGELVRKTETGGMFTVEDVEEAQGRADAWELSPTGPMFGSKMRWPNGEAADRERALLEEAGITLEDLKRMGRSGQGTRRPVRIRLGEAELFPEEDGFAVQFTLPKGSYATVVIDQLLRQDDKDPEQDAKTPEKE